MFICLKCETELDSHDTYEYRGAYSCSSCFEEVQRLRNIDRNFIIEEEKSKTNIFKGLDLDSRSPFGKINREILQSQIEIASKETSRIRKYERGF